MTAVAKVAAARPIAETEVVLTRVFDAPRALVFQMWIDPKHAAKWWGPRNYPAGEVNIDARPGGQWRHCLQSTEGKKDLWLGGVYREIAPPERLVYTEIFAPYPDTESVVTAVFTDEAGKTRLRVSCEYPSQEVRDMVMKSGMERGAAISYDRLEDVARELAG